MYDRNTKYRQFVTNPNKPKEFVNKPQHNLYVCKPRASYLKRRELLRQLINLAIFMTSLENVVNYGT